MFQGQIVFSRESPPWVHMGFPGERRTTFGVGLKPKRYDIPPVGPASRAIPDTLPQSPKSKPPPRRLSPVAAVRTFRGLSLTFRITRRIGNRPGLSL